MWKDKSRIIQCLKLYFSSVFVYSLGIWAFNYLQYYQRTLGVEALKTLNYLYFGYLLIAPLFYYFYADAETTNKSYLAIRGIAKYFSDFYRHEKYAQLEKQEKVAILFMLVKVFYLPTMLGFFFSQSRYFIDNYNNFQWYVFSLALIFSVDTFIFSFGYAFEGKALKNVVKSVEPTLFGWAVTLICYPPFNSFLGRYVEWGANDYVEFWNPALTTIMRILVIFLLAIYVIASIALGTKASNLTNRGIVASFPYNIIRHPAYASKVFSWWLTLLPIINWPFAIGMCVWTAIYYFRAITEEKHLSQDPDYIDYCKKVKYRFVPGIY